MSAHCTACQSTNTIQDGERGEICCTDCGVVLADRIGDTTDYHGDTHAPVPVAGTSTVMGAGGSADGAAARLRRRDGWIAASKMDSSMRNGSLGRLRAMHDKMGLPESVFESAARIYRSVTSSSDCRGRHLMSIMTASLYVACREADAPRTLCDLYGVSGLPVKAISKYVRFILDRRDAAVKPYSLPRLINRVASTVGASPACRRDAMVAAGRLDGLYLSGKNPLVVAAAVLYVAAVGRPEKISAGKIASAFNVSEAGVRHRASEIRGMIRVAGG